VLINGGFIKKWRRRSESHTLRRGVNNCLPLLVTFIVRQRSLTDVTTGAGKTVLFFTGVNEVI
jgi:hypothetical protein